MTEQLAIDGVVEATSITTIDRIKALVLGPPGSGKSMLLTTARPKILIIDFDDRRESIAGKENVDVVTLVDKNPLMPDVWPRLDNIISTLEYNKTNSQLRYQSVCLDTLTTLAEACGTYFAHDTNMFREYGKNNASMRIRIPQGWDVINAVQRLMKTLLRRLFALNIDIYATMHIRRQKAADWTQENPKFTDKYTCEPQYLQDLIALFNERWFMRDDYRLQVGQNYEFNAITALHIDKGDRKANIKEMLDEHTANITAGR